MLILSVSVTISITAYRRADKGKKKAFEAKGLIPMYSLLICTLTDAWQTLMKRILLKQILST